MFYAAKWQKTLWSMWQIYNKGKNAQNWLTSVPKEVLEMDCWKPVDSLDDW